MNDLEAWPFIVARNATLDWRPILAPPFLLEAEADYLLVTQTAGPRADPTQPNVSVVESAKVGPITLVFRSVPATSALLGRTLAEPLLDRFGRPLHVVEGLVIRGAHQSPPGNLRLAIDSVRAETLRLMPAFWEEESETAASTRSQPMQITVDAQAATVRPQDSERRPNNGNWPPLPLAVVLFVALGAAAWWWCTRSLRSAQEAHQQAYDQTDPLRITRPMTHQLTYHGTRVPTCPIFLLTAELAQQRPVRSYRARFRRTAGSCAGGRCSRAGANPAGAGGPPEF